MDPPECVVTVTTETRPAFDRIEMSIARDLARRALLLAPLLALGVGLWRGLEAAEGVLLALAVVSANFFGAAALVAWAARRSFEAMMSAMLGGFVLRLLVITAVGVGIKALDIVDWPVFCITLVAAHLGLLAWETR